MCPHDPVFCKICTLKLLFVVQFLHIVTCFLSYYPSVCCHWCSQRNFWGMTKVKVNWETFTLDLLGDICVVFSHVQEKLFLIIHTAMASTKTPIVHHSV